MMAQVGWGWGIKSMRGDSQQCCCEVASGTLAAVWRSVFVPGVWSLFALHGALALLNRD
jgi:hypothetical protein